MACSVGILMCKSNETEPIYALSYSCIADECNFRKEQCNGSPNKYSAVWDKSEAI